MPRLSSSLLLSLGLLGLGSSPSLAAPLPTLSGPDVAPCGEALCVDLTWTWGGSGFFPEVAGDAPIDLPTPDPGQWVLSGGEIRLGTGNAQFGGSFRPGEVPILVGDVAGYAAPLFDVLGTDGALLTRGSTSLIGHCGTPAEGIVSCGDGNSTGSGVPYDPTFADPSVQGLLTLHYDFHPYWFSEPASQTFYMAWGGRVHLVYAAVPEPSSVMLVTAGLLGLAGWRRRRA